MKILVADDDATFRLIAKTMLQSLGHECTIVGDGEQAWEHFQRHQIDVVISDWMMPGLSGLDLCRNIRAVPGSYTYFIVVTANGGLGEIVEGMNAGADEFLVKPLRSDDLHSHLVAAERVTSLHRMLASQRTELEALNHELNTVARRDPLTGLRNRRALDEDLHVLEARVARYGHSYTMALLDVDHFKSYNDAYGHPAGDKVLQSVAGELSRQLRSGDAVYRYGGEEFLGLLPEQTPAGGRIALERMRNGLERLAIPHGGNPRGVLTLSAGIAVMDPRHVRPASEVLAEADEALYRAKHRGRNRIEQGTPDCLRT